MLLGSQGCIPLSLHCQTTPQVPPVHMEQSDVRIHLPALWTRQCPSNFHKVIEASNGTYASTRGEADSIPGRYPGDAPVQGISGTTGEHDFPTSRVSGIHSKSGEVQSNTNSADPVSGLCDRLNVNEVLPTRRESPRDQWYVPESPQATQGVHSTTVPITGQNDGGITSSSVSPTPLPAIATAQDQVIQKVRVIRRTGDPRSGSHTRLAVVERSRNIREWERDQPAEPRPGDRD